jgi:hypothetical protein
LSFTPGAFSLLLEDAPPPPANQHYELWFLLTGVETPVSLGSLPFEAGRIQFQSSLAEDQAQLVSQVLISIEPDFDDDPSLSSEIAFRGERGAGEAPEILLFPVAP